MWPRSNRSEMSFNLTQIDQHLWDKRIREIRSGTLICGWIAMYLTAELLHMHGFFTYLTNRKLILQYSLECPHRSTKKNERNYYLSGKLLLSRHKCIKESQISRNECVTPLLYSSIKPNEYQNFHTSS